jgi:hypothetical protein
MSTLVRVDPPIVKHFGQFGAAVHCEHSHQINAFRFLLVVFPRFVAFRCGVDLDLKLAQVLCDVAFHRDVRHARGVKETLDVPEAVPCVSGADASKRKR